MKNPSSKAREITFSIILPDTAFVSNFSMILRDNQEFVARVEEKKKADDIYKEAVQTNSAAGLVQQDTRNANQIVVSVNVEPHGKAKFRLTYEELLQRHLSKYQHVIHVNLDQVVEDFNVQVNINESLPVIQVRVPELKTDPNAIEASLKENQYALVEKNLGGDPSKVQVIFKPDATAQKLMLEKQTNKDGGIQGEFIVEYDVDRKDHENDVQVLDGYFVHFFAPESLSTLPKHVVFVLDISGSMLGEKLQQTKDAMVTILDDLTEQDHFNILTFSDDVTHWAPEAENKSEVTLTYKGTKELRDEALRYVLDLQTIGGTNIHDAMMAALKLVTDVKVAETVLPRNTKPIIVFLTDGEPTTGVTSRDEIKTLTARANDKLSVPIYGLAFGRGADFELIKSISLTSGAFGRKIFEGSDAAIQLEDFYHELANPLLNKVKFQYVGESIKNESITNTDFQTYFKGGEYIVAGQISNDKPETEDVEVIVGGEAANGIYEKRFNLCFWKAQPLPIEFDPIENKNNNGLIGPDIFPPPYPGNCILPPIKPKQVSRTSGNFIERLWAFLTIKNLLDDKISEKEKRIEELTASSGEDIATTVGPDSKEFEDDEKDNNEPTVLPIKLKESPKKSSREEKALELALQYNFVTKLTSLVVTRPQPIEADGDEENSTPQPDIAIDPTPIKEFGNRGGYGGGGYGIRVASRFQYAYSPSYFAQASFGAPQNSPQLKKGGGIQITPYQADQFDQDYDDELESTLTTSTTSTTTGGPCNGNITLYSQTYHRGENMTTSSDEEDIPDLHVKNFDKKATSLVVHGNCCWTLFSEPNYEGKSLVFRSGGYKSAADVGHLFRNVLSLKNIGRC